MVGVGFGRAFQILVFISLFFPNKVISHYDNSSSSNAFCIEIERDALLKFKKELEDSSNRLSSWIPVTDCCKWHGIHCDSLTGHVKKLQLANPYDSEDETEWISYATSSLKGNLSDSPSHLKHLSHLDLSHNDFRGIQIPSFLRSLVGLNSLNLTNSGFQGLNSLTYLHLSRSHFNSTSIPSCLYSLQSLQHLHLSELSLQGEISTDIANLTNLVSLDLSWNELEGNITRSIGTLCNSRYVDLSENKLDAFESIFQGCLANSFIHLILRNNNISGHFLNQIANMTNLHHLDLSDNFISGCIPEFLGNLSSLRFFTLDDNKLNGTLPRSIGLLSNLEDLRISRNSLEGIVSDAHFANLTSLRLLDLSENNLTLSFSLGWIPPFNLEGIYFRSCNLGPQFPKWLESQKDFVGMDLSNANISDMVPNWFWSLSTSYEFLKISHNQLSSKLPDFYLNAPLTRIYLGSNKFYGNLPRISSTVKELDLSNNFFYDNLSHFLCYPRNQNNKLESLNLMNNRLFENIPNCLTNWMSLIVVTLSSNILNGKLPNSIGSLNNLQSLHLRNNSLSGKIPRYLKNCFKLRFWI